MRKNGYFLGIILAVLFVGLDGPGELYAASTAGAFKICKKTSTGALAVRQKCKSGESAITNISALAGTNGTNGTNGSSFYDTIPSGVTITGVIGGDFNNYNTSGDYRVYHSFPAPIGRVLTSADVIVANTSVVDNDCTGATTCLSATEATAASTCTGTAGLPTAPAGKVCIYPITASNASDIDGFVFSLTGQTTTHGFFLDFAVDGGAGDVYVTATWAYTQP